MGPGGYAAAPMLLAARFARLPIVLQEQNAWPGLTTRWFARGARQIHLGFPEAAAQLKPGPRTDVFTPGNPIVPLAAAPDPAAARARLGIAPEARVVFAFGGSQGARILSQVIPAAIERLGAAERAPPRPAQPGRSEEIETVAAASRRVGLAGELQRVADEIGHAMEDLRRHVVVRQDDRVPLALQREDRRDVLGQDRPFEARHVALDPGVEFGERQRRRARGGDGFKHAWLLHLCSH